MWNLAKISNSTFYSKRIHIPLPSYLHITTFISSYPHHGKTGFIDAATGDQLSYFQLWQAVDSVSAWLFEFGIRKGNVVLIIAPNSFFPIVCLSVMSLGAIITTSNPLNTPREIGLQMADSKAVLVFTTSQTVLKLTGSSCPIVHLDDETTATSQLKLKIVNTVREMLKKEPRDHLLRRPSLIKWFLR